MIYKNKLFNFNELYYIYLHTCLFAHQGKPCANFIQLCDDYQKRENNWFQMSRIDSSVSSKLEAQVVELKQWIWILTCVLFLRGGNS